MGLFQAAIELRSMMCDVRTECDIHVFFFNELDLKLEVT